jgi:capsule polysaccharide modification protein KpsS
MGNMNDKELREKTKHRTFTSMAARRRWWALHLQIQQNREREDWMNGKIDKRKLGKFSE